MPLGMSTPAKFFPPPYINEKGHKIMGKITPDKEENEVTSKRQTDMAPAFPMF